MKNHLKNPSNISPLSLQKEPISHYSPFSHINTSNDNNKVNSVIEQPEKDSHSKCKSEQISLSSSQKSSKIKNRKIDPDLFFQNLFTNNNISTNLSAVQKEHSEQHKRLPDVFNDLSNEEKKVAQTHLENNELTVEKLLNEIEDKNKKLDKLENEIDEYKRNINIAKSELNQKNEEIMTYNEMKELFEQKDCEKEKLCKKLQTENESLNKENKYLTDKLTHERIFVKQMEMKYTNTINDLAQIIAKFKHEYN
jgi:chromosome segregation ATPase